MKESNIIENDNENTNIADKQIQLISEIEKGINGWQLKWNTYKEKTTGKKMVNLTIERERKEQNVEFIDKTSWPKTAHITEGYPLLRIEMPEKITDLDNQSKIKLLCSDGNIQKIKKKICEYQDRQSKLLNEKNKEEIAEHLKSSEKNERLEVMNVFGNKFDKIYNYHIKSLTKNIITWQTFNMVDHNINSYENKLKFLEDTESSIKENNGEWKNDLGAQFIWKKIENKNKVELFIRLKPSTEPVFKEKGLVLDTFGIDVNDYKSKLQILYGNAFRFSGQEDKEKKNEQELEKKDIIDELLKSLSTPEKTFAYPDDGREGYRFVIKDNFVFLQRPISIYEQQEHKFKGYKEIADVTSAFQDIDSIQGNKNFKQIITNNMENILKSCSNLDKKDKEDVCGLLDVNYDKYYHTNNNYCCYGLCPSCCELC